MKFIMSILIFSLMFNQNISENNMAEKIYITTDTGLKYYDIKIGQGDFPKPGDILSVHYTGQLEDGTIMGIKHKEYNLHVVQFHPESIETNYGKQIIKNFINIV